MNHLSIHVLNYRPSHLMCMMGLTCLMVVISFSDQVDGGIEREEERLKHSML